MAKVKDKLNVLAVIGGLALMLVAWRYPIDPVFTTKTTLLSFLAVVLGSLAGYKSGLMITIIYVLLYVVGAPSLLWYRQSEAMPPLLTLSSAGFVFGLPLAALTAGLLAPFGQGKVSHVFLAAFAGHAVFLACGVIWWGYLTSPAAALEQALQPYLLGIILKSLAAAGVILGLRKFIK